MFRILFQKVFLAAVRMSGARMAERRLIWETVHGPEEKWLRVLFEENYGS